MTETRIDFRDKRNSFVDKTKYDLYDNIVVELRYSIGGKLNSSVRHKYDYDKTGNWIKEIYSANKERPLITERKIAYYASKSPSAN